MLLLVEDKILDTASAIHDGSLLRRGFLLLAVAACLEELLSLVVDDVTENQVAENSTDAAGKRRLVLLSEEKGLKFSADRMLPMEAAETPAESLYGKEKKLLLDCGEKGDEGVSCNTGRKPGWRQGAEGGIPVKFVLKTDSDTFTILL
jgi:hypothetical protein